MACRLVRSLRRVSSVSSLYNHSLPLKQQPLPGFGFSQIRQTSYISEMRKTAFEGNILRLLRNEIQYELESSPPSQPVEKYGCFKVDERPGEQWIRLSRNFGEKEVITVDVTMFDHSIPAKESGDVTKGEDVQLHLTMIVNISKGEDGDVLEFMCSAWPDSVEILQVFSGRRQRLPGTPYLGPGFSDLDDELQMALYEFLETRGISDELAAFLHEYMKNKDKLEFIRWMGKLKSYIETKVTKGVFVEVSEV